MGLLASVLAQATFFIYPFPLDSLGTQSVAMVRGKVIERPSGKSLAGVTVYASSPDAGVQTAVSDRRGDFYLLTLSPGNYGFWSDIEHLYPSNCDVIQRARELDAGFEYVVIVNVGRGCSVEP